jgi:hypothetical protein
MYGHDSTNDELRDAKRGSLQSRSGDSDKATAENGAAAGQYIANKSDDNTSDHRPDIIDADNRSNHICRQFLS